MTDEDDQKQGQNMTENLSHTDEPYFLNQTEIQNTDEH